MATKAWYYWTAIAILSLLTMGSLRLSDVPVYHCELEGSYKRCIFLKDNDKTCVQPLMINGSWTWKGDRCQKGYNYGNWTLVGDISNTINIKIKKCVNDEGETADIFSNARIMSRYNNISVVKPTMFRNARFIKKNDNCYVVGNCISALSSCG